MVAGFLLQKQWRRQAAQGLSAATLHIARKSTRWRHCLTAGGHEVLHMDVVRRFTRWKSWFGGNDFLFDKGAYGRRIKMIVVVESATQSRE